MGRKEIELILGVDVPNDSAPFVIEFVNQLVAEHSEQWVRDNCDFIRAQLQYIGVIPWGASG